MRVLSHIEAKGRRKNMCPDIHIFTYFSTANFFPRTIRVVKKLLKNWKLGVLKLTRLS